MVLDEQAQHLNSQSLARMPDWLVRKWTSCIVKAGELGERLQELREEEAEGLSDEELREQWDLQVIAQTKSKPRKPYLTACVYPFRTHASIVLRTEQERW